jgi:hypothetical protein
VSSSSAGVLCSDPPWLARKLDLPEVKSSPCPVDLSLCSALSLPPSLSSDSLSLPIFLSGTHSPPLFSESPSHSISLISRFLSLCDLDKEEKKQYRRERKKEGEGSGIRALGSGGLRVARVMVTRVSESLRVTGSLARQKSAWASTRITLPRRISVLATGIAPPGSTGHSLSSLFVSLMLGLSGSLPFFSSLWLSLSASLSLSPSASRSLYVSPSPCVCVLMKHREERRRKKE